VGCILVGRSAAAQNLYGFTATMFAAAGVGGCSRSCWWSWAAEGMRWARFRPIPNAVFRMCKLSVGGGDVDESAIDRHVGGDGGRVVQKRDLGGRERVEVVDEHSGIAGDDVGLRRVRRDKESDGIECACADVDVDRQEWGRSTILCKADWPMAKDAGREGSRRKVLVSILSWR